MTIRSVELREVELELRTPFVTAAGTVSHRRILILRLITDSQEGWAECSADGQPYSAPESSATAWRILVDDLLPGLVAAEAPDPAAVAWDTTGRPMAVAAVEAALWDLHARQAGLPLAVALGGQVRPVGARAVLGVTDPTGLLRSAESAVAAGYRAVKAKIAPGRVDGLDGLRAPFPDLDIAADANGSFDPDDPAHVAELAALDRLGLSFIEQPFTRGDLAQTAALRATIGTPICLDEDVRSVPDAASVMKAEAADLLNLKSPRVGGHGPARRIVALSADAGIGVWWGGLLETGIGRAHAVAAATMVTQGDLPADLAASDRYYVRDVTEPWVLQNGALRPSDRPGIGVDVDIEALDHLTIRAIRLGDDHTAET